MPRFVMVRIASVLALFAGFTVSHVAADDAETPTISGRVVDEAGNAVAGAVVESQTWHESFDTATTDADGRFTVTARERLFVSNEDSSLLGYDTLYQYEPGDEIEIVLKPARIITINAAQQGEPVDDARIEIHSNYFPVGTGATDAEGVCRVAIPRDAFIQTIMVYKPQVGFAGTTHGNEYYTQESDNSPDDYAFELAPTARIIVRCEDRQHRPLPGIEVYPWLIQQPDQEETLNIGATGEMRRTTNDDGEAVFDIFPANAEYVAFGARPGDDYHTLSHVYWRPGAGNLVALEVWQLVTVAGAVFDASGAPAVGVNLQITGDGPQSSSVRNAAVTDEQGRYEFRVPPAHAYSITVVGQELAARTLSGFVVPDEGVLDDQNLQLVEGTVFRGTVRTDDDSPLQGGSLMISERVESQSFVINGEQQYFSAYPVRYPQLNEAGEFSIVLPPGDFYAYYNGGGVSRPEFFEFIVTDQAEITHDFVIKGTHTEELAGRVLREVNGTLEPMEGVVVSGVQIDPQDWNDPAAVSDESGAFQLTWQPGKMFLHALSDDGAWGATRMLDGVPEDLDIVLRPTSTATGQILTEGVPLAGFTFDYNIRVDYNDGSMTHRFGGTVETDDEGRFELTNLVQDQAYWCSHNLVHTYYHVVDVTAADEMPVDLGQLEFDSNNRARTPIERLQAAFLSDADAGSRLDEALANAAFHQQHVLLIVGNSGDEEIRNLFRVFFTQYRFWDERGDSPLRQRLHDYELCGLTADEAVAAGLVSEAGSPTLLVLSAAGETLGTLSTVEWVAADGTLNESDLSEFLNQHRPADIDIEQMLEAALADALASDEPRLILVHEVDTYLPKSRQLSRFVAAHAETFGQRFVYLPVNPVRAAQGYELLDALASDQYSNERGQGRGSSWVGIMSADGELLGSMKLEGNAAGLTGREAMEFIDLISLHSAGLSQETVTGWRDAFLATEPLGVE